MNSETPLVRNRAGFSSPPVLGGVAAASADGVVLSYATRIAAKGTKSTNEISLFLRPLCLLAAIWLLVNKSPLRREVSVLAERVDYLARR